MSFIEVAFTILEESKQPITFQEMLNQIQEYLELSDAELKQRMVQFYTDLNFDGRFITLGENRWGLRAWYPVDQLEEEVAPAVKTRKKKTKKAVKEDFDEEEDLEDLDEADEDFDFDEEEIDELEDEDEIEDLEDLNELDDEEEEEDFDEELVAEDEYDLDEEEDDDQN
nr:DNA-directed RNA polymerase subunit delta [Bacillus sp. REN10]